MPASSILLLESDAAAGVAIAAILSGAGYMVTQTADPDEGLHQGHRAPPHRHRRRERAQVRGRHLPRDPRHAGARRDPGHVRQHHARVEERIHFLEAGADDVMARPFDAREMEARVEALLLRFQRSRDMGPVIAHDGLTLGRARRTVAVYSPKGGVGTTTVATNIAIAAVAGRPDRVILVDFALQFGGVATLLNLDPKQTIADVVREDGATGDPELLRTFAMRHDSGLHVLAAPAAPEAAETITPAHVAQILRTLLDGYDLVVVDAGSTLDERVLTIFENAEAVILPVTPEIAALKAMHALLEYLGESGTVGLKSTFVLNDLFAREILKLRDVESFLGAKVAVELPYDPFLYLKAVNEGVPIVLGAPRSIPAERLVKLSAIAFGEPGSGAATSSPEKKSGGLFRRRH